MSESQDLWVFDDLPEPGVFSGVMTLLGLLSGAALIMAYVIYGPGEAVTFADWALLIGFGALFTFLVAAFLFLIGWLIELAWPVFLLMILVGVLLLLPLYFYFGIDVFSQAVMWGNAF